MISLHAKTKVDLSGLRKLEKRLKDLCSKQVESGFYDDPHYSGMTTAQLMTIHEFGYGNLPQRNVMLSSALSLKYDIPKYIKQVYRNVVFKGQAAEVSLKYIGKKAEESIKFTIDAGTFSNPKVSPAWSEVKGFDDAMIHFGDLRDSARYKIEDSGQTVKFGRF